MTTNICAEGCACGRHVPRSGWRHTDQARAKMRGRVFSEEHRKNLRLARASRIVTDETRERHALATARRYAAGWVPQVRYSGTVLERALGRLLTGAGIAYEEQVRFGRYVVDFWDSESGIVYEADGSYWHRDAERESRRDAYLLRSGVVAVVHLDEVDLRPWMKG